MNKVLNWTVGSFFRTIGRLIAFIVAGIGIAYVLSISDIDVPNIFRHAIFMNVKADTFVQEYGVSYTGGGATSDGWNKFDYYTNNSKTSTLVDYNFNQFTFDRSFDFSQYNGYMYLDFYLNLPIVRQNQNSTFTQNNEHCERWGKTTINGREVYECILYSTNTETNTISDTEYVQPKIFIYVILLDRSGGFTPCTVNTDNKIVCPINNQSNYITGLGFYTYVYYNSNNSHAYQVYMGRDFSLWQTSDSVITNAITNQTIQDQQQHEEMMDSNTTQAEDDAEDFFETFDAPDIGGLSAIITAPLSTIQSLLNSTCTNLVLPLPFVNENLTLPCMNDIYTQHFGAFFSLYQTIILGIIAYRCIRSIFFDLQGFANPSDDRIEVMDL